MIVKKVNNPKKSASKGVRIGGLANYIAEPEQANNHEKCVYSGGIGFICDDRKSQTAEMLALAQEAYKSKDTINHYVLSWRELERPTHVQFAEAAAIFLKELGLEGHQALYGVHADTNNMHMHMHIMVNRVHPDTFKVTRINKGFDLEAAHRAIARIEHIQGWQSEKACPLHGLRER